MDFLFLSFFPLQHTNLEAVGWKEDGIRCDLLSQEGGRETVY